MPNECRMSKSEGRKNPECPNVECSMVGNILSPFGHLNFGILSSVGFRHSGFPAPLSNGGPIPKIVNPLRQRPRTRLRFAPPTTDRDLALAGVRRVRRGRADAGSDGLSSPVEGNLAPRGGRLDRSLVQHGPGLQRLALVLAGAEARR